MRNCNPIFTMPPSEQSTAAPVEGMIQVDAASYWRSKYELEELRMKISELSGKVDTLISIATNYKNTADSQQAAQLPQDDPEVEALGQRIDDAIAVLQGSKTASQAPSEPVTTPPVPTDPNAPVT